MDKVCTFWADVTPLLEEKIYQKIYSTVPDFRKEKADLIRFQEDRALSIGAWRLYSLARESIGAGEEIPFNLSHSGRYAMVSIAPEGEKAGCDVEKLQIFRSAVAKRFFCPGEYDWIMGHREDGRAEAFYRLWVLKESFLKATRYGMKLGLDTFEFDMAGKAGARLMRQPDFIKEQYYFKEFSLPEKDAKAAVCSTCSQIETFRELKLV